MTLAVTHNFVSTAADTGESGKVGPTQWNDSHALSMATARFLGRLTAGVGSPEELTAAQIRAALFSGAMVKKSADQTGANFTAANTTIPWTAEVYDTDSYHDNVTNNSRLTVPSGVNFVMVGGSVRVQNATNEGCALSIAKNGSTTFDGASQQNQTSGNTGYDVSTVTGPIQVTAGDFFELIFFTSTDTSVDIIAARSNFWIMAVG